MRRRDRSPSTRDGTHHDTDGEASETLTEPDTDTEEQLQELGMIWAGRYLLGLQSPPLCRRGDGRRERVSWKTCHLCTRSFAKSHDINLRNPHARFNFFPENKGLFIMGCSRSPSAQLAVNGDAAMRRPYHLNQQSMKKARIVVVDHGAVIFLGVARRLRSRQSWCVPGLRCVLGLRSSA
jgi:hypothetical protein